LLRVLSRQSHGSRWIEPGNAITRAVYSGAPLAKLETWADEELFVEAVAETPLIEGSAEAAPAASAAPTPEPRQEERPKRPGVAA
jgi:hypothetical protein